MPLRAITKLGKGNEFMSDKKLIYAVDDEESICELYSVALKSAGFDCSCFSCGDDLFSAVKQCKPDLVLLDIMLADMDGFSILQKLKNDAATRDIPVIMVSAKGEEISKVKGLDLGANDYIAKPFGVLELVARIKANLRKTVKNTAYTYADIIIDESKHEAFAANTVLTLTLKEYELLKLLVENASNVVSRERILNVVWGEDYLGETRTLDIHIAKLRKSISMSAATIITVRGVGYCLK